MNKPKQHLLSSNPSHHRHSSIKSRFTRGFLRALIKMKKKNYQTTSSSSTSREIFRRYRRVKIAADKSMAVAVGSRRAWSRAMLWRIHQFRHHHQTWRHRAFVMRRNHYSSYNQPIKKRILIEKKKKNKRKKKDEGDHHHHQEEERGIRDTGELRKLVPGGETMDLCSLLDETAHYIKCLVTQVQVMRSIDQFYSNI
ncbi:hypothetical protein ACOSP7_003092 [Xanthoceras sorbifolium]